MGGELHGVEPCGDFRFAGGQQPFIIATFVKADGGSDLWLGEAHAREAVLGVSAELRDVWG